MTREIRPRPAACLNCGSTQVDAFCASCGQRNVDMRIPARDLALDAVEDGLSLDSRVARTVLPFLFRPGRLTVEWTSGRRARYSSPLRLYLLTSFVFFLAASFAPEATPAFRIDGTPDEEALAEARKELETSGIPAEIAPTKDGALEFRTKDGAPVPAGTAEQHEKLRAQGWVGRTIDDRWKAFEKMSQPEAVKRVQAAFREWVPRIMFFLVPAAVLILAMLWPRRWLSEHVVLSLHLHAFAFTIFSLLLLVRLLPAGWVRAALVTVLWFSLPAWFLLALRRVYGQRWKWTVAKGLVASLLYLVALGIGLAGVAGLALYFA